MTFAADDGPRLFELNALLRPSCFGNGITEWILDKLLLVYIGSGLTVLLIEDTEDTGSDLVMAPGWTWAFYVVMHDIESGWKQLTTMLSDSNSNGSDVRPSTPSLWLPSPRLKSVSAETMGL